MQLLVTAQKVFTQLSDVIVRLDQKDFSRKIEVLSNATIGQHIRHVIEFFNCLMEGYESGIVNYDKRNHDRTIEVDKALALSYIRTISENLCQKELSKTLLLEADYEAASSPVLIQTVFERELVYNIEHTIHHMALIKVGIKVLSPELNLPADFGVAASTIRHQQKNVHSNLPS